MRPYQEDYVAYVPARNGPFAGSEHPGGSCDGLAVLADGMGGHAGGATASRIVCDAFVSDFTAASFAGTVPQRLTHALDAANTALQGAVAASPHLEGMGSTLIGVAISGGELQWISVGDSPLYLVRGGDLALLNEDHSLAPALDQMAADGRITLEQARADPRRHMLRSAVTGDEIEMIDLARRPLVLAQGDVIVLASDGIHTLEADEIVRIVRGYRADGSAAIAAALIRAVDNARIPMQDNTSVIVVRVL
jgi:protein phosphatase